MARVAFSSLHTTRPLPTGEETEGGRDKRGCERRRGSGSRVEERERKREEI
jgi:hypothetical protein